MSPLQLPPTCFTSLNSALTLYWKNKTPQIELQQQSNDATTLLKSKVQRGPEAANVYLHYYYQSIKN